MMIFMVSLTRSALTTSGLSGSTVMRAIMPSPLNGSEA
jgi:hypothetical protein